MRQFCLATPARAFITVCIWAWMGSFIGCGSGSTPTSPPPARDFSILLVPATITADAGGSSSTFTVSIAGQNGFADPVLFLDCLRV